MKLFIAFAAFFVVVTSPAPAQGPRGSPPVFKIVASTEPAKGQIVFNDYGFKKEARVEKRKVLINGQEVEQTVTVEVMVPYVLTTTIDAGTSRIITPDGKQLPIDEVWKRIKAKSVVVVSGDNNTPAAIYLQALNAETIVVIPGAPKKN